MGRWKEGCADRTSREKAKETSDRNKEQGPFGVLGKHESEGTPHQAIDTRTPPVLVLREKESGRWVGRREMEIGQIRERLSNEIIT